MAVNGPTHAYQRNQSFRTSLVLCERVSSTVVQVIKSIPLDMHLPGKRFILIGTLEMKRIIALENPAFNKSHKSTIKITRLLISIFGAMRTEKNLHVLKAS